MAGAVRGLSARLREVSGLLAGRFGRPDLCAHETDPVRNLVLTILSQNTTDANRDRAYDRLAKRFPTLPALAAARPSELEEAIRVGGLARAKAKAILGALARIREERGGYSLDFLRGMPLPEARAYLTSFPGVGVKTANILLLFSFGMPAFPVDTHVLRVTKRLGLVPGTSTLAKAALSLEPHVGAGDHGPLHLNLIRLGREVCRPRDSALRGMPPPGGVPGGETSTKGKGYHRGPGDPVERRGKGHRVTVRTVFQMVIVGLVTLLIGLPAIALGLLVPGQSRKGKIFRWVTKSYSMILLPVFGVTVETRGVSRVDRNAPYVFMSNHASHVDSLALAVSIPHPLHWVFKKELSKIPVFGWVLLSLGQIMVDRRNAMQSRTALSNAASALKGNNSVLIYVEGTRSKDGKLQPLKKGGFHIALHSGLPIVPVRVSGSHEIVPSGSLRVRPGHVVVELFDPIPTEGKTEADVPELMARVRDALLS